MFKKLSKEESEFLERPFIEEEIWLAISSCDNNKSPGPDGFIFEFIKKIWSVVKEDLIKVITWFGEKGK